MWQLPDGVVGLPDKRMIEGSTIAATPTRPSKCEGIMEADDVSDREYFENKFYALTKLKGPERRTAIAAIQSELSSAIASYDERTHRFHGTEAAATYAAHARGYRATLARIEALALTDRLSELHRMIPDVPLDEMTRVQLAELQRATEAVAAAARKLAEAGNGGG
jgi:hypothetical protein